MALSKVNINKSTNNLGRIRQGQDHISGLLSFGSKPSEFGNDDVKLIGSVKQAETLGITTSSLPVLHYHISEYFRVAGNSQLYVGIYFHAGTNAYTFEELISMQSIAGGQIRQFGVYLTDDLSQGLVNLLQGIKDNLDALKMPASMLLTANIVNVTVPDLSTGQNYGVSVITDQSGQGTGATLFGTTSKTIGALGAVLGAISSQPVHRSIAGVEYVTNLAGNELDVIATGDGSLYTSLTYGQIEAISNKQYLQLVKHPGYSGTFINIDYTAQGDGDLNRIRLNRTIDKAIRGVNTALTGKLSSEVVFNSDGSISESTAKSFESIAGVPLANMTSAGELSDFSVFINRNQDVQGTDNLNVEINLLPIGAAEFITVNIGFTSGL